MPRLIVIGIGQTLRGDDAAGVEAVRLWQRLYPETAGRTDLDVQFSELPGLSLLDVLEGFQSALLVDAVQSGRAAGQIHRLSMDELASFGTDSRSAHGWGVAETLHMGKQLSLLEPGHRIRLIAIEAQQFELGQPMSDAVKRAMATACLAIEDEVQGLLT